jgi:transposase
MYIGVDTHKKLHVLVALDEQGRGRGMRTIANTPADWLEGLTWARSLEGERCWGLENSGSLGRGFAQFLLTQGEGTVHEVSPHRTAQYRRWGRRQDKTDELDALAIARLLMAEAADLPLVLPDDVGTELRLLSDHRDQMLVERTRVINQLHAQMLQIDPDYLAASGPLTRMQGVRYCWELVVPEASRVVQTRVLLAHQLAAHLLHLMEALAQVTTLLRQRVHETGTSLLRMPGVGEVVAARLIGELGSTPRVPSAAALAALAGIAPVAVSSGGRGGYRLNHGGNRQLNRAFHVIALTQRRCEPRARAYYAKKLAEGKTKRAAMRCLKRRLVDVLFPLLEQPPLIHAAAA